MTQDKFSSLFSSFMGTTNANAVEAITSPKREMTEKKFAITKLNGKTTADGFIQAHRDFLNQRDFLSPTLQAYDLQQLPPAEALHCLQSALIEHVLQQELEVQQIKMLRMKHEKPGKVPGAPKIKRERAHTKNYTVVVTVKMYGEGFDYLQEGENWEVETYQQAQNSVDRYLSNNADTEYATIQNNYGTPISTTIYRSEAIERFFKAPKRMATRNVHGQSTKTLKWQPKMQQTRVVGPWSK